MNGMQTEMTELRIPSSDGTAQPSLFYEATPNRPLLVGLHTWSYDRFNQVENMLPLAKKNDWNLLLPEFRGPNLAENPHCREACGSPLARRDILDAIRHVTAHYPIDEENILLAGASGGGHMALLVAAEMPELFRAVCSFVPITDLAAWRTENPGYAAAVDACCGGEVAMRERSPISYTDALARGNVKIFSGKWDGVVPPRQGLDLYTRIFASHPEAHVYFEMFDGGHEMRLDDAERFFLAQMTRRTEKKTVTD